MQFRPQEPAARHRSDSGRLLPPHRDSSRHNPCRHCTRERHPHRSPACTGHGSFRSYHHRTACRPQPEALRGTDCLRIARHRCRRHHRNKQNGQSTRAPRLHKLLRCTHHSWFVHYCRCTARHRERLPGRNRIRDRSFPADTHPRPRTREVYPQRTLHSSRSQCHCRGPRRRNRSLWNIPTTPVVRPQRLR